MDKCDFLWKLCEQNLIYCRHHENQRAAVSRLIWVAAAGAFGLAKLFQGSVVMQVALAMFVVALGLFSVFVCEKEYERFDHHYERFRKLRDKLIEVIFELEIEDVMALNRLADENVRSRYSLLLQRSPRRYWTASHILISIIGFLLMASILFKCFRI